MLEVPFAPNNLGRHHVPRPLAFDRKKRLVAKGDFDRAFRHGSRARGSILLVVARPNGLAHTRLGLSVGKVIWKRAVKRNRVRRIFREAFRLCYGELPVGFDLVLIPAAPKLEPVLSATCAELVAMAHKAARRAAEKAAAAPPPRDAGGDRP
ncbi:MAG: ribonuclease P protein component [Planctomycetes bacterium]|nr:ribonuclease P protein component [Planctomycetota bacterium]